MSKEVVLQRIRAALGREAIVNHASAVAPAYHRVGGLSATDRLKLLESRLEEYDARVFYSTETELPARIAAVLIDGRKSRLVHPSGLPGTWLDSRISWTADTGNALPYGEIELLDGVLTAATAAVAESGSIVLQHGPLEGRRALTLLPDYHLCVLYASQVVETLPECFERLKEKAGRPTTFVSGPSATADIEMTRIKGVHGPRFLDVILVC